MGFYYINAVLRGLDGKFFDYESKTKGAKGKPELDAYDMALLLTVAYRQPNPGEYLGVYDTICYGSRKTIGNMAHLKKTALDERRKKLMEMGLLDYVQRASCPDPKNHGKPKEYDNVYRINLATIRKLYPDEDEWMDILCFKREKSADKRLLSALYIGNGATMNVRNADAGVRNADAGVRNTDAGVRNTDTNNNKQHKNKNTQYCECDALEERIVELISSRYNEADSKLLRNKIKEAIAGKYADSVNKFLDDERNWSWATTYNGLLSAIKKLPNKEDDPAQKNNAYVIAKNYPDVRLQPIGENFVKRWNDMSGEMMKMILDTISKLTNVTSADIREKNSDRILKVINDKKLKTPKSLYDKLQKIAKEADNEKEEDDGK